jgi:putative spermidine/putrescine transport system permease protein
MTVWIAVIVCVLIVSMLAFALRKQTSRFFFRHGHARLAALVLAPLAWLVIAYLGSLGALLLTSLYRVDSFTTKLVKDPGLQNFEELITTPVYRRVVLRSILVAAGVTVIDLFLAIPVGFYLAKVATARVRRALAVLVTMPLWASYLVKAYAMRSFLDPADGLIKKLLGVTPGFGLASTILVLAYLWLPYAILPIYAGLERLPNSLLEASSDLGAHAWPTMRRVILPILAPAVVAASIFTFSLSLGDYLAVDIVGGKTQLVGSVVYDNFVQNGPLAAAVAVIPMIIMTVYLLGARATGALDNL